MQQSVDLNRSGSVRRNQHVVVLAGDVSRPCLAPSLALATHRFIFLAFFRCFFISFFIASHPCHGQSWLLVDAAATSESERKILSKSETLRPSIVRESSKTHFFLNFELKRHFFFVFTSAMPRVTLVLHASLKRTLSYL